MLSLTSYGYWENYRRDEFHSGVSRNSGPTRSSVNFIFSMSKYQISSSPAIDMYGYIYFGSQDYHLYKITSSGSLIWSYGSGGSFISSPALSYNNEVVYCGNTDTYLYAVASSTGSLIWKMYSFASITSSPYVYGVGVESVIFIGSTASAWFGINATNGNILMSGTSEAAIDYSSIVLYKNSLYFGCIDSHIYAYSVNISEVTQAIKWTYATGDQIRC